MKCSLVHDTILQNPERNFQAKVLGEGRTARSQSEGTSGLEVKTVLKRKAATFGIFKYLILISLPLPLFSFVSSSYIVYSFSSLLLPLLLLSLLFLLILDNAIALVGLVAPHLKLIKIIKKNLLLYLLLIN